MQLTTLAGNSRIKERLSQSGGGRGMSHAFLLCGPDGSGKHTLAQSMAAGMLCTGKGEVPCGGCSSCKKVFSHIHPDVITVTGEGDKPINVDQVRELRSDALIRPNEGVRKVYILEQGGQMNPSAQNAMLKLLEEGPEYAAFLILCQQPGQMLETIRSRCEELSLIPVPVEECRRWLSQRFPQADPSDVEQAARDCQGILGRAVEWLEGGTSPRQEFKQQAQSLISVLESGDEITLFECAMALDKLSREELSALLDILDEMLIAYLPRSRSHGRIFKAVELVRQLRDAANLNVGSGALSGWLCAGMFSESK